MRYLLFLILLFSFGAMTAETPSLKDLEFYAKEGDFKEFVATWKQLPLSLRSTNDVSLLLVQVSETSLKGLIQKEDYSKKYFELFLEVSSHKAIKSDPIFWDRYATYLLSYFKYWTIKEGKKGINSNVEELLSSKPVFQSDSGVALYLFLRQQSFEFSLFPLSYALISNNGQARLCEDEIVVLELIEEARARSNNLRSLLSQISKECVEALKKSFREKLFSSDLVQGAMIYSYLEEENPAFLIYYFLQAGPVGETLNEAFALLKRNKENFSKRDKLLKKMEEISPMPGLVFSLSDQFKRATMTKYLEENFPEYPARLRELCSQYKEDSRRFKSVPVLSCDLISPSVGSKLRK